MPLLTTFAGAGIRSYGFGGGVAAADFEFISSTVLSSTTATVTFTGLPTAFRHLELRYVVRGSVASPADNIQLTFNGDTAGNYSYAYTMGNQAGASYGQQWATANATLGIIPGSTATANVFGFGKITLPDFQATTKYQIGQSMNVFTQDATYSRMVWTGFTRKVNAATTSITFSTQSGSFVAGSRFSLYGYKG